MKINEAIFGRRSVREYTSQEVDEQTIRGLIEAAVHAPSAVNQQPWTFTVVCDKDVLDRISRAAKSHMVATMPPSVHSDRFRFVTQRSQFPYFLSRASARADFRGGTRALDRRRLRTGRGKSDACRVCCRPRNMLDRLCSRLPQHARWKETTRAASGLGTCGADHCWSSKDRYSRRSSQGAGCAVGWLTMVFATGSTLLGVIEFRPTR
jgi:nitroreductase